MEGARIPTLCDLPTQEQQTGYLSWRQAAQVAQQGQSSVDFPSGTSQLHDLSS